MCVPRRDLLGDLSHRLSLDATCAQLAITPADTMRISIESGMPRAELGSTLSLGSDKHITSLCEVLGEQSPVDV
jgi:hypothetical protein